MRATNTASPARVSDLLEAARGGDEDAFRRLVGPHRSSLHTHCYRMLASPHDAEDALQDALLRAWRGLPGFDGRSSVGTWLHRIATNACLNALESRKRRPLPSGVGAVFDDPEAAFVPGFEVPWLHPLPVDPAA